jgi:hypothetical protein
MSLCGRTALVVFAVSASANVLYNEAGVLVTAAETRDTIEFCVYAPEPVSVSIMVNRNQNGVIDNRVDTTYSLTPDERVCTVFLLGGWEPTTFCGRFSSEAQLNMRHVRELAEDVQSNRGGARFVPGSRIKDFREPWFNAVALANVANPNVSPDLLFHDLRRSGVRVMVQEAGIPESQAMLISGRKTRTMLERYNIGSLKNIPKLDAWSKRRTAMSEATVQVPTASCGRYAVGDLLWVEKDAHLFEMSIWC